MVYQHGPITITTTTGGAATVYSGVVRGKLLAIKYAPGTLDTGADLTITGETNGQPLLTVTNAGTSDVWYFPRKLVNANTNAAAFTDAGDTFPLVDERIKCVVAQGGNTLTGTITYFVED